MMTSEARVAHYAKAMKFPQSLFIAGDGRIVGTWIMGNDYRVKSGYYGGYPPTYLKRVRALFPDKKRALHLFSGRVDTDAFPGDTVDCNPKMKPTYCVDANDLWTVPLRRYDLILADPPYSVEDALRYGTPMINRNAVIRSLASDCRSGTHVVWLDQVLPMYRKADWVLEGVIGMVKSTNHRFRVVTIFKRK